MKIKRQFYLAFVVMILLSCNNPKPESNDNNNSTEKEAAITYDFEELVDLNLEDLRIKRNEVYARRGRKFESKDLQEYFKQFDWYEPRYDNVQSFLTDHDRENIRKVKKAESIVRSKVIYSNNSIQTAPNGEKTTIKMQKFGGVYHIPVVINGTEMFFIFDTGASTISISNTEAYFLFKQGKLTKEDIVGEQEFIDANGDISTGTVINLREVKLGNYTIHNVEASVVDNLEAPLLLGQSALNRFGKIEVDYQNESLILQK
jgi:aspartyl protease family protein